MLGKGRYDDVCTEVRKSTKADGVMLMVFNGRDGSGISMQATPAMMMILPDILEGMAADIRKDLAKLKS